MIEYNANMLYGLSSIGMIISLILLIMSLPFIGVLEMTGAFLLLTIFFGASFVLSKKVYRKKPLLSVVIFYFIMVSILSIAIYMGTYAEPDTTATIFVVLLLILSLFIVDVPWRPILLNTVMVALFCYFDIRYKSEEKMLNLDLTYVVIVLIINALFIIFGFRRNVERYASKREVELLASQREYLINSLPVGVAVYKVYGNDVKQTYTNEQFYRLFEDDAKSRTERTKGNFLNSIHPHDQAKLQRAMKSVIVGGKNYISEICRSMKGDGSYLWVRFSSSVAKREGDYLLVYSTYESVEEEMKSKLAMQAKTEFLSRMSHDIRTPMNAIMGLTHLAKTEDDIEAIHKYLENIDVTSEFLLGLINDILDLNKIESGEFSLHPEPYECKEFLEEINTVIGPLMDKKQINFLCKIDENMPCILVDKLRFNQIFFNLLSNASKFTNAGGTVQFICKNVPIDEESSKINVTIIDNGIGMSEEFQKNMFVPFIQENNEINDKIRGTGLGLPIVKSLVDAMGASIKVTSKQGEGTEYMLDFVVKIAKSITKETSKEATDKSLEESRILLVEDNDMNILVAQKLLEKQGCIVAVAKNGAEVITYSGKESKWAGDGISLSDIHTPQSLDEFAVNVIFLNDDRIWCNEANNKKSVNIANDLISLGKMIKNSVKASIILILPQNKIFKYDYGYISGFAGNDYRSKYELKNMLSYMMKEILVNIHNILPTLELVYENTKTDICGKEVPAAFYFQVDGGILRSKKSNKITVIKCNDFYVTTLAIETKEELELFLGEINLLVQKQSVPEWINEVHMFDDVNNIKIIEEQNYIIEEANKTINDSKMKLEHNMRLKSILYTSGDELVEVIFEILRSMLGCDLSDFEDKKKEDYLFNVDGHTYIGEIKGVNHNVKNENVSQLDVHYQSYLDDNPEMDADDISALLIMNHQKNKAVNEREPIHENQINLAKRNGSLIIETITILKMYEKYIRHEITREECLEILKGKTGLLSV